MCYANETSQFYNIEVKDIPSFSTKDRLELVDRCAKMQDNPEQYDKNYVEVAFGKRSQTKTLMPSPLKETCDEPVAEAGTALAAVEQQQDGNAHNCVFEAVQYAPASQSLIMTSLLLFQNGNEI